jgi:2-polyprenyl-3-methyl-5-hydroxy-6-metoxy-1,4-benzoquinol methylase
LSELITIFCPLCKSPIMRPRFKLNGWQLVQCEACEFVYVNPRPPVEVIEQGYRIPPPLREIARYGSTFNLTTTYQQYYAHTADEKRQEMTNTLTKLLQIGKRRPAETKLLDFGCGNGAFLEQALAMGIDAYGCDLGDWMTSAMHDHNLLSRVFIGKFDQAPYEDESFDIIHARGVLGHLYSPRAVLRQFQKKLKPDGILTLMSTPNFDSIFIRLRIDSFDGNVPLVHLNFFSKKTLVRFLKNHEFRPMYTRTWGVPLRVVVPPYFPGFTQGTRRYYQSDVELSLEHWRDNVIQSKTSGMFKKIHLYAVIKNLCNTVLNLINGGTVVDVIARKEICD